MSLKELVIGGVAAVALIVGILGLNNSVDMPEQPVGAAAGPEHYVNQVFHAGFTSGSGCFATSTTGTLTATQLERNSCIYLTATGAGQGTISLTLPATTTISNIIPNNAGYCRSWFIDASDLAAATTTTFVAGTGWNLVGLDATGAGTGADVIDGAEYGKLTACRETDSDIVGYIEEWIAAD